MKILSNGSERLMLLSWEGILSWRRRLGEAGLLRGHVAPLLDDGLLDRSGVGSEVLLALLLLLGVVVGDVGGVAPLVVAMVTLDHVIVLNLLNHLDLVNTSLAVGSGRNCGDII